jgi:hypothetical protein
MKVRVSVGLLRMRSDLETPGNGPRLIVAPGTASTEIVKIWSESGVTPPTPPTVEKEFIRICHNPPTPRTKPDDRGRFVPNLSAKRRIDSIPYFHFVTIMKFVKLGLADPTNGGGKNESEHGKARLFRGKVQPDLTHSPIACTPIRASLLPPHSFGDRHE